MTKKAQKSEDVEKSLLKTIDTLKKDLSDTREALEDSERRVANLQRANEEKVKLLEQATSSAEKAITSAEMRGDATEQALTAAERLAFQRDRLADHNNRLKAFIETCLRTATFDSTKAAEVLKPVITAIVAGMFFGLPIGWFLRRPKAEGLAAVPDECSHDGCAGRPDPRCAGRNCSEHCQSVTGCHGRCLDVWQQKQLATIGR